MSNLFRRLRIGGKSAVLREEDGAEIVEFAVSTFLLLMLIVGLIYLTLFLFTFHAAAEAARHTARWLSVNGTSSCSAANSTCVPTAAQVTAHLRSLSGTAQMTATVTYCTSTTSCSSSTANAIPGNLVQVQVSQTYGAFPYISSTSLTATSTSQMAIWQ